MLDRRHLGTWTWPEFERRVLAVPLGSTEQHGPHLPLDTDTRIAVAVSHGLALERSNVVVAPALPFGSSGEHAGFPGTLSIGGPAFTSVVVELVRSADEFAGVVLVSAHGGNAEPLDRAVDLLRGEGRPVLAWLAAVPAGDAHAGLTETSLMLAIAPELVRLGRAMSGNTAPLAELLPTLRSAGVRAVSPTGVLGNPTGATAEQGRRLLGDLVDDLVRAVDRWAG